MRALIRALILIAALASAVPTARGQSTAFTYQGELKQNGQPANGAFDLRLRLYDAASAGQQLGSMQCFNDAAVTNGRFTTSLDFNQQFASINARYQVSFTIPFTGTPTVTASAKVGNCGYIAVVESVPTTGAVIIITYDPCGSGRA